MGLFRDVFTVGLGARFSLCLPMCFGAGDTAAAVLGIHGRRAVRFGGLLANGLAVLRRREPASATATAKVSIGLCLAMCARIAQDRLAVLLGRSLARVAATAPILEPVQRPVYPPRRPPPPALLAPLAAVFTFRGATVPTAAALRVHADGAMSPLDGFRGAKDIEPLSVLQGGGQVSRRLGRTPTARRGRIWGGRRTRNAALPVACYIERPAQGAPLATVLLGQTPDAGAMLGS